jgi:hypothetical protein
LLEQRFPLDKKQISDRIDPSPCQRRVVDLGTTFQIDEFRPKEKLSNIKRRDGYFGSGGEKNLGSLFQKDKEDL